MQVTTFGDSVYMPSESGFVAEPTNSLVGPSGRWVRAEDPEYEAAFIRQLELENSWVEARDEAGDG